MVGHLLAPMFWPSCAWRAYCSLISKHHSAPLCPPALDMLRFSTTCWVVKFRAWFQTRFTRDWCLSDVLCNTRPDKRADWGTCSGFSLSEPFQRSSKTIEVATLPHQQKEWQTHVESTLIYIVARWWEIMRDVDRLFGLQDQSYQVSLDGATMVLLNAGSWQEPGLQDLVGTVSIEAL